VLRARGAAPHFPPPVSPLSRHAATPATPPRRQPLTAFTPRARARARRYKGAVVSALPGPQQAAAVAAVWAALGAATYANVQYLGPAVSSHLPAFLQVTNTCVCGLPAG